MGLRDLEPHGNARGSDGFFHKALLQAKESDQHTAGGAREVKVVANGHCHSKHERRGVPLPILTSALQSRRIVAV